MPHTKSAVKRIKQYAKRQLRNRSSKSDLKTNNKKLRDIIKTGDKEKVGIFLKEMYAKYDKAAKKGIIHPKNAARNKSKLAKLAAGMKK